MKHLTVLYEKHPVGMTCSLCAVCHHENGLSVLVYPVEQPKQTVCCL